MLDICREENTLWYMNTPRHFLSLNLTIIAHSPCSRYIYVNSNKKRKQPRQ